ncbi:endoplasmic reticulum membrane adapter protein XK-like [Solea solea]|uniref:endoplasmic reticulum membrane adapter protein XK-like n=1 Tax=Solea solea TaxID=90069 RepID=UPI00272D4D45|nr:endoplasmic reticulum membrane adapter protein XK-like [Solea solea]
MCEVIMKDQSKVQPPFSIVLATLLYVSEFIITTVVCTKFDRNGHVFWMSYSVIFLLLPAVLSQLTLTFIHRDLGRDRPLVFFLHLVLLGPVHRCIEALWLYYRVGEREEPYFTICRKIHLEKGHKMHKEWEESQSESKLTTHRDAFKRTTVIQAFLGSTPQLTLQLYVTIQQSYVMPLRLILMIINLISITYGALVCSVLAIQIRYEDYKLQWRPTAYLCMIMWRFLEISTRIIILVLFSTALSHWVVLVAMVNLLIFFFLPWVEFWTKRGSMNHNVDKDLTQLGTIVVLCVFTLLYACINVFCWSALQLDLYNEDLIRRKQTWYLLTTYYLGRFIENIILIGIWFLFKSDFVFFSATLLCIQLVICYSLAVFFMLLFFQYCHPCRSLFKHNIKDFLSCVCCSRVSRIAAEEGVGHGCLFHPQLPTPSSTAATMVHVTEQPHELQDPQNSHFFEQGKETVLVDMVEGAYRWHSAKFSQHPSSI